MCRKFVSCAFSMFGMIGGFSLRNRPQLSLANHLCALTSDAPLCEPSRFPSTLLSKRTMISLPAVVMRGSAGKDTSRVSTLLKVCCRVEPLKGVVANCP